MFTLIGVLVVFITLYAVIGLYLKDRFNPIGIELNREYQQTPIGRFPELAIVTPLVIGGGVVLLKSSSGAYYGVGISFFKRNFIKRLDTAKPILYDSQISPNAHVNSGT